MPYDVLGAKAEIEKKYAAFAQGKPEYEGVVEKIDAIIEKSTPTPVSYTHLDVYKRQEYERVIYKVCYLYTTPNATLNDLYQDTNSCSCLLYTSRAFYWLP